MTRVGATYSPGDEANTYVGKVSEVSGLVSGRHDAIGCPRGGGNDQVMGASRRTRLSNVGQQRPVLPGNPLVIVMYRQYVEDIIEKRSLRGGTSRVAVQFDSGEIFGHHDRRNRNVVILRQHVEIKLSPSTGNDHAGVEYQACHGSASRSADAASRPAATAAEK